MITTIDPSVLLPIYGALATLCLFVVWVVVYGGGPRGGGSGNA